MNVTKSGVAWFLGIAAALAFFSMTTVRLDAQGMYYDEIHQAPAAFFYIGETPAMFAIVSRGVPVMNMTYSGAIKSTLYGLYLRYVGGQFTAYSWRMFGIVLAATGLLVFYRLAGVWLPLSGAIVFEALLLTDTAALLMTRHDFGPVALALALRLAFLGIWIEMARRPAGWGCFLAGAIIGFAIFEKLSSVVLLIPFVLFLWMLWRSFRPGVATAIFGFGLGCAPLILVNLSSLRRVGVLISLQNVTAFRPLGPGEAIDHAWNYLNLGPGIAVPELILGSRTGFSPTAEWLLMLTLMLLIVVAAIWERSNSWLNLSALCALSYAGIGVGLFLLPQITSSHHWIIGTPFQYAAIALALAGFLESSPKQGAIPRGAKAVLIAGVMALVAIRVPNVITVEASLLKGESSDRFSPEFTRVAELAAARSASAIFVSSDWGTGTQLYCAMNGKPGLVFEPFWAANPAPAVLDIAGTTEKPVIYVFTTGIAPQFATASEAIVEALAGAPAWQESPVEREFSQMIHIRVRKFVRREQARPA